MVSGSRLIFRPYRSVPRLLGLDSGGFGDSREAGDFTLDVVGELSGCAGRHLQALCGKRRFHIRPAQNLIGFAAQAGDDCRRRSGRREQPEP